MDTNEFDTMIRAAIERASQRFHVPNRWVRVVVEYAPDGSLLWKALVWERDTYVVRAMAQTLYTLC